MVVVENNDDGASTIDDAESIHDSILVDFSDNNNHQKDFNDDFARQQQERMQRQQQQELQQNEQQFAYIQQLLREIERLRAQLDRFSVEVII